MRRPGRCWPPPPPPCPRPRAGSATGTTATCGSATPPSRCGVCTPSAWTGRPTTSSASSPTSAPARRTCRSCTASAASGNWHEPDQGIWEVRGPPRHFLSSKLMCWVACDRGARLARLHDEPDYADRWQKAADEIRADVLAHGLDERGVFAQHYDTTALDASVLLMPLVRFLPADDERIRRTVLAVADELSVDGLVLRYRTDETDDGLSGEEATFTICSFWLVSALVEIGETARARELCEKLLSYASPLGLYAEELDPRTGRHLGNFPQALTP